MLAAYGLHGVFVFCPQVRNRGMQKAETEKFIEEYW
jgi:hypothetical protein